MFLALALDAHRCGRLKQANHESSSEPRVRCNGTTSTELTSPSPFDQDLYSKSPYVVQIAIPPGKDYYISADITLSRLQIASFLLSLSTASYTSGPLTTLSALVLFASSTNFSTFVTTLLTAIPASSKSSLSTLSFFGLGTGALPFSCT